METIGPYRVVRELGRGAMGVVFEAIDSAIGRTVALKIIRTLPPASAEEDAQLKLRFAREASAAGRLSHPNIVTIYQLGEHDGMQYLAMEYVAGTSLEAIMKPGVRMSFDTALPILMQIAAALDYAHGLGMVHRDIKPANILVTAEGAVKLTDFGIARITSPNVTNGVTTGIPAYMAPEQILASNVDGRADQFSLAVVAYQMLAGERPFEAPTQGALFRKIGAAEPRPLDQVNPQVPRPVAEVVSRGLSQDPSRRFASCSDLVAALRAVAAPAAPVPGPPPVTTHSRGKWLLIAACALLVAVAAWYGFRAIQRNSKLAEVWPSSPPARSTKVNPKDGLTYVWIPPGTFQMGCSPGDSECESDETPVHEVTLTKGFWMGRTPVTVGAWRKYSHATGKGMPPEELSNWKLNAAAGNDNLPVVGVRWAEATNYCGWAAMRLPTEAEWEWAARAGTTGARYGNSDAIAWYADNSGRQRIDSTAMWNADQNNYLDMLHENGNGPKPVGKKQPNEYGLYDMLGNVWQWTADWYGEKYYQASGRQDPSGTPDGTLRVLRGGSWGDHPGVVRVSSRNSSGPGIHGSFIGLRCVRD